MFTTLFYFEMFEYFSKLTFKCHQLNNGGRILLYPMKALVIKQNTITMHMASDCFNLILFSWIKIFTVYFTRYYIPEIRFVVQVVYYSKGHQQNTQQTALCSVVIFFYPWQFYPWDHEAIPTSGQWGHWNTQD